MKSWQVFALLVFGATGCVVSARPGYGGVYSTNAVVTAPTATVVTQPTYVNTAPQQQVYTQPACGGCVQGTQEFCNGCDDNCNGVIDENCR